MTKVAIFYCGIIDDKLLVTCSESIKNNMLDEKDTKMFMVLSSNMKEQHESFLRQHFAESIGAIEWVDHSVQAVQCVKQSVIELIESCISEKHCDYFKDSDALLEYYRIYRAYQLMTKYEYTHKVRFDYITRIRPDAIFCSRLQYPPEQISAESIQPRMDQIQKVYKNKNELLSLVIHSLYLPQRIETKNDAEFFSHSLENLENTENNVTTIIEYIQSGKYIVTIGKNLMFVTKRHHFSMLSCLGVSYGQYFLPGFKQWLDPPYQFQICALLNGYTIFDSITKSELQVIRNFDSQKVTPDQGFMFIAS